MVTKYLKFITVLMIIFSISSCSIRTTSIYNIESNKDNVVYDNDCEYIYYNNKIHILNKTSCDEFIQNDTALCMGIINDILYYISQEESVYNIKRICNGYVESVCSIPFKTVEWCDINNNIIYVYSGDTIYSIDYQTNAINIIKDIGKAQHIVISGNYIYYNKWIEYMPMDDAGFTDINYSYLGQKIYRLNIENGIIENIFSKIQNGQMYYIKQISACTGGIIVYISDGVDFQYNIVFIDENNKIQTLEENISFNIDCTDTDGESIYYIDDKRKSIMKLSLNSGEVSVIYDYLSYEIIDILGIANKNIYLLDKEYNILQYNILLKSVTIL